MIRKRYSDGMEIKMNMSAVVASLVGTLCFLLIFGVCCGEASPESDRANVSLLLHGQRHITGTDEVVDPSVLRIIEEIDYNTNWPTFDIKLYPDVDEIIGLAESTQNQYLANHDDAVSSSFLRSGRPPSASHDFSNIKAQVTFEPAFTTHNYLTLWAYADTACTSPVASNTYGTEYCQAITGTTNGAQSTMYTYDPASLNLTQYYYTDTSCQDLLTSGTRFNVAKYGTSQGDCKNQLAAVYTTSFAPPEYMGYYVRYP
jgi:hypothetical protein